MVEKKNKTKHILLISFIMLSAITFINAQKKINIDSLLNLINKEIQQDSVEKIFLHDYFSVCHCSDINNSLLIRKNQSDYKRIEELLLNFILPNAKLIDREQFIQTYELYLYWYKKEFSDFIQQYDKVCKWDRASKIARDSNGIRVSCKTKIENLKRIIFRFENILFAERFKNKTGLEIYSTYMESNYAIKHLMSGKPYLVEYERLYPIYSKECEKLSVNKISGVALELPYAKEIKTYLYEELINFAWDSLNTTQEYKEFTFSLKNRVKYFFQQNYEPRLELYFEKNIHNWFSYDKGWFIFKVLPVFKNKELIKNLTHEIIYDTIMIKRNIGQRYQPDYNKEYIEKLIKRTKHTDIIRDVILEEAKKHLIDDESPALKYIRYFNEKEVAKFLIDSLGLNTTSPQNKVIIANTLMQFYNQL